MAQLKAGDQEVADSSPRVGSFVETDHEVFSTAILYLPLIQEGRLSVSGERMCTILFNCWFKKGGCQFLAKECAQYWLTADSRRAVVSFWRKNVHNTDLLLIQEGRLLVSGERMLTV